MDVYQVTFAIFVLAGGYAAYHRHKDEIWSSESSGDENGSLAKNLKMESSATQFKKEFISVYILVMGSDWLQGPYIYTLYKDEKGLVESVVAALFMTGFIAAALSAIFMGSLADKYGRRYACLSCCVLYSASCMTTVSSDLVILFIGRVLGGISTTLIYSVFESWMVTEYHNRGLANSSLGLGSMFALLTTLNSIVAIVAGLVGQLIVFATGTKSSPFIAAIPCLGIAFWLMLKYWNENYGDSDGSTTNETEKSILLILREDMRIVALGFICCCFEGTMYLFIYFWSPALKSAHKISRLSDPQPETRGGDLPFGIIFATFMCAMMLGSLGFSFTTSRTKNSSLSSTSSASMLATAIVGASMSLLVTVFAKSEVITLWCFCVFEMCVGIYYPCMGYQKGQIVDDRVRAKIYGLMRIPLNVFVVIALSLTTEGDTHRNHVFLFSGGLLLIASIATAHYLDILPDEYGHRETESLYE